MVAALLSLILAYFIGSIPFGLLITRLARTEDLRSIGSGNIGATNVLRTGRKGLAIVTLLLDALKGAVPVWLAPESVAGLAAVVAVAGHCYPVWLKFQGGKGVATSWGALMALSPLVGLLVVISWISVFYWKRISSLAALVAASLTPIWCLLVSGVGLFPVGLALSAHTIYRHKENIGRLLAGTEGRFRA
jgi:glycerol-3-phosphate acyltransferase PlsY